MSITTNIKNEYFETADLNLACAISLFFPIDSIENNPQNDRSVFLFSRKDGLDEIVQQYWQNTLKVSPQQYAAQLRLVKTRLYESRRYQS